MLRNFFASLASAVSLRLRDWDDSSFFSQTQTSMIDIIILRDLNAAAKALNNAFVAFGCIRGRLHVNARSEHFCGDGHRNSLGLQNIAHPGGTNVIESNYYARTAFWARAGHVEAFRSDREVVSRASITGDGRW